jgi:hypothetical protein
LFLKNGGDDDFHRTSLSKNVPNTSGDMAKVLRKKKNDAQLLRHRSFTKGETLPFPFYRKLNI